MNMSPYNTDKHMLTLNMEPDINKDIVIHIYTHMHPKHNAHRYILDSWMVTYITLTINMHICTCTHTGRYLQMFMGTELSRTPTHVGIGSCMHLNIQKCTITDRHMCT